MSEGKSPAGNVRIQDVNCDAKPWNVFSQHQRPDVSRRAPVPAVNGDQQRRWLWIDAQVDANFRCFGQQQKHTTATGCKVESGCLKRVATFQRPYASRGGGWCEWDPAAVIEAATAAAAAALSFIVYGQTSTATAVAGRCDERVYTINS